MDDLAKNREVRYPHEVLKIYAEVNGGKETMHTWGGLIVQPQERQPRTAMCAGTVRSQQKP